jgi:CHAT domain-containing protein
LLALGEPSYDATSPFTSLQAGTGGDAVPEQGAPPPVSVASATSYRGHRSACSDFAVLRFEALPATGEETREIVHLWKKHGQHDASNSHTLDLREAAASEAALKRFAPEHRVLHLATHGFFLGGQCESALDGVRGIGGLAPGPGTPQAAGTRPVAGENPLVLSGLALAGANHRTAAGDGEEDGILTAEEIASLDLSGAEWAVLSACETGVGDIRVGEGVFGLRRAFQVAGVGTLIMSLWSVDDEATRSWMEALYSGRLARGLDTAEAVRQASLTVIEQRRDAGQSTHPFYWAAFVAAGDWR